MFLDEQCTASISLHVQVYSDDAATLYQLQAEERRTHALERLVLSVFQYECVIKDSCYVTT